MSAFLIFTFSLGAGFSPAGADEDDCVPFVRLMFLRGTFPICKELHNPNMACWPPWALPKEHCFLKNWPSFLDPDPYFLLHLSGQRRAAVPGSIFPPCCCVSFPYFCQAIAGTYSSFELGSNFPLASPPSLNFRFKSPGLSPFSSEDAVLV